MSWPLVKVGEVSLFVRGVTFTPDDQVEPFSPDSSVVMRTKNVQVAGLDESDLIAIPSILVKRTEQILQCGDILISSANSWELVGKASYVSGLSYLATAGGFISIVRAKRSLIDSRYLYHWISSPESQHKIRHCGRQTTNISNLDVERFKELEIPLPPLEEQKRIAAILDKADAIRRKRQQAIKLADDFLRYVFLEMFGDPVINPKGWEVTSLSNLVSKLGDGLHGTPVYDCEGDYHFINGNNLDGGKVVIGEAVKRISQSEYEKHKKDLNENTMLVSINGTIGKVAFYNGEKIVLGKSACYFNLIQGAVNKTFLYHLISGDYFKNYVSGIVTGSTIKNVSLKSMREFPVLLPPTELQERFSAIEVRVKSMLSRCKNGQSSPLFETLSQQAFSGKL